MFPINRRGVFLDLQAPSRQDPSGTQAGSPLISIVISGRVEPWRRRLCLCLGDACLVSDVVTQTPLRDSWPSSADDRLRADCPPKRDIAATLLL
uniref:Uncharacterized protein n=1 Tax=Steinernema glaseri TaxID=37863 RepID=A0A1I7ZV62_9BILA